MDDLAVLASTPEMLQQALDIAARWAKRIRMRFNNGPTKSAIMVYGAGAPNDITWRLGGEELPRVLSYKYLLVVLASNGGWNKMLTHLNVKATNRTGELVRWARANKVTLDVLERLGRLHVQSSVLWGIGTATLNNRLSARLDMLQRKIGRVLLGHSKRSIMPTVCCELGWLKWSTAQKGAGLQLLGRLCHSENRFTGMLLELQARPDTTWAQEFLGLARPLMHEGWKGSSNDWSSLVAAWRRHALNDDSEESCSRNAVHTRGAPVVPSCRVAPGGRLRCKSVCA